jgi:hypothetical protein
VPLAVSDFTGPNVGSEQLLAAVLGTAQPMWLVDPGSLAAVETLASRAPVPVEVAASVERLPARRGHPGPRRVAA